MEPAALKSTHPPSDAPRGVPAPQGPAGQAKGHGGAVAFVVVLLVLAGLTYWFYPEIHDAVTGGATSRPTTEPAASPEGRSGGGRRGAGGPTPVIVAKSRKGDLPVYLTGLGTVTPLNTVTVRSRVDGAITRINFTEGQEVNAGDVLVEIDPRPFEVQLLQAKGSLARDQALLANAQLDLTRFEKIGPGASGQELDTAKSQVAQYQATVVTDQANIESAQLNITYSKIIAPISGRVGLRLVDLGNMVHASDTNGLVVITQLSPITVVFSLPQTQLPDLLDAMDADPRAKLQVDAFDDGYKRLLSAGALEAIDNQIDISTGSVKLKANFENAERRLFPNGFVNVRLLEKTFRGAVLIPAVAKQIGPDGNFVYVVDDERKVHVRKVAVGETTNEVTQVTSGLNPGETVVTDGVDKLTEGAQVIPRMAGTSRPASGPAGNSASRPNGGGPNGGGGGRRNRGAAPAGN